MPPSRPDLRQVSGDDGFRRAVALAAVAHFDDPPRAGTVTPLVADAFGIAAAAFASDSDESSAR